MMPKRSESRSLGEVRIARKQPAVDESGELSIPEELFDSVYNGLVAGNPQSTIIKQLRGYGLTRGQARDTIDAILEALAPRDSQQDWQRRMRVKLWLDIEADREKARRHVSKFWDDKKKELVEVDAPNFSAVSRCNELLVKLAGLGDPKVQVNVGGDAERAVPEFIDTFCESDDGSNDNAGADGDSDA